MSRFDVCRAYTEKKGKKQNILVIEKRKKKVGKDKIVWVNILYT